MKLAIIAPHNLNLALLGDCQFALAQEVNEDNAAWYAGRREWDKQLVILDNGSFELGRAAFPTIKAGYEGYMEIAEKIHATDVIAPDVQWNPKKTLELSIKFAKWFRKKGHDEKYNLMSVVWPAGPGDFGWWFEQHQDLVAPDVYGIGKWLESQYADGTRVQLIKGLEQNFNVKPEQLHALGCPYAWEVYELRNMMRSLDTGIALKAAQQGIVLSADPYKRIRSVPLRKDLNEGILYTAKGNANYLLQLAHSNKLP